MDCRACSPCFSTNWGHREEMKSLIIHLRRNEITVSLSNLQSRGLLIEIRRVLARPLFIRLWSRASLLARISNYILSVVRKVKAGLMFLSDLHADIELNHTIEQQSAEAGVRGEGESGPGHLLDVYMKVGFQWK